MSVVMYLCICLYVCNCMRKILYLCETPTYFRYIYHFTVIFMVSFPGGNCICHSILVKIFKILRGFH